MARKTLKQKLRKQIREIKSAADQEHELAGITINFELQAMQAVALGHGLMTTLIHAKNVLGVNSEDYQTIEKVAQERISQCLVKLVDMGIPAEEANHRILQGH